MERITNLLADLERCVPELNVDPLYASLPADCETPTVTDWLYHHLAEQKLIVYKEWPKYNGDILALKPLAHLSFPANPADFIFTLRENIDWSRACIDRFELPYVMPWLEHINFYLQPYNLRLIDLLPFENAYILCVHDHEASLEKLHASLEHLGLGINQRLIMDRQQTADYMQSITSG